MNNNSNILKEQEQQSYNNLNQFSKDHQLDVQFETGLLHPKKIQYLQENNSYYYDLLKRQEEQSLINQSEVLFKSEASQGYLHSNKLIQVKIEQHHAQKNQKLSNFLIFQEQMQQQLSQDTIFKEIPPKSHRIAKENLISMCGLKELSSIVYGFMPVSGNFKCITIANELNEILSLNEKNSKVAGSCKRRICDILNILMGVGLLKKDGKKFQMIHSIEDNSESKQQKKLQAKIQIQIEHILAFRKIIKARESLLKKQQLLLQGIHSLKHSKSQQRETISLNFPFIVISAEQIINTKTVNNNITISTLGQQSILGDSNVLQLIINRSKYESEKENKTQKCKIQK